MEGIDDASLDFVHAHSSLASEANPAQTLARWLDLLKPGGFAIVTVPDEDLYEKGAWPSRFDESHQSSFTICKPVKSLPQSVNVLDLVCSLAHVAECERLNLIVDQFDPARADEDQTTHGIAECAIELVLRKRAVPGAHERMAAMVRARDADQALRACVEGVRAYPYRYDVYHHAHLVLLHWRMEEEADGFIEQSAEFLHNERYPQLVRALHMISRGKLQEGFRLREAFVTPSGWTRRTKAQPPSGMPAWYGEPLEGKCFVIWSEFGLGDEIFFFRFARILRERCGARAVSVVCQTPLVELFEASGEADAIIDVRDTAALHPHDYWVYPHAIPAHLPLDLEALPPSVPYLLAPGAVPALPNEDRRALKVGFAFKRDPTHENDRERSAPSLSVFDALFGIEGVEFYSVQKGAGAEEVAAYAAKLPNFHDLGAGLGSMAETAGVLAAMDLVIAVDTSIVHLAGAMGKPVWLMLPFYGDWRWHYTREDSPWYPTIRLFRREFGQGWAEVAARIEEQLRRLAMES